MTNMATEVETRPRFHVGARVRIVETASGLHIGTEGVLRETADPDNASEWNCCNGVHRFWVETDEGRRIRALMVQAAEDEPESHQTPGMTGEGDEVRPGFRVGDRYQWTPGGNTTVSVIVWDDDRLVRLYSGASVDRFRTEPQYENFVPVEVVQSRGGYDVGSVMVTSMGDLREAEDLSTLTPEEQLLRLQRLIHRVASAEAVRRDWCNEINTVLGKLDLPDELSSVDRNLGRRLRDNPEELFQWREEPESEPDPEPYTRRVEVEGTASWTVSESWSYTDDVECDHDVQPDEECQDCIDSVSENLETSDITGQLQRFDRYADDSYSLDWEVDSAESEVI